jgi:DNA-binding transcriptional MerR regulator
LTRERLLTTEEVVAEASQRGFEISERTLKYYVSLGLVSRPGRHPSAKADKRVLYFPEEVLDTLAEIRRLQDSGLTLEQIRQFLTGSARPDLQALAESSETEGTRMAERVIRALLSQEVGQAYRDFLSLPLETGDEALRESGRAFYQKVLEALVGAERARQIVTRTFARLTPAQWERKLTPLLRMRAERSGNRAGAGGNLLGRTLTSQLHELANRILAGQPAETELAEVKARLKRLTAKYSGVPETNAQRHEIARFMSKALEVYSEALWLLEEGARSGDRPLVQRAVARADRAGVILEHLENMIAEKRELLRLCHEEDLQIP